MTIKKQGALFVTGDLSSSMGKERLIYLDNHATTQVDPRVASLVVQYMTEFFGNPSSVDHNFGEEARRAIDLAKERIRVLTGANGYRTVLTSGSTESINLALRGFVAAVSQQQQGSHAPVRIGLTAIEHPAVSETCAALEQEGLAELAVIPVDQRGRLAMRQLEECLQEGLDLVCVMAANNVVGTINKLDEITELAHAHGAFVFVDATQAVGHVGFDATSWAIDAFAFSAHKLYGPKGVGALVADRHFPLTGVWTGGSHQGGLRPGTLNVPGIVGFGRACELRSEEMGSDEVRIAQLRDTLQKDLAQRIPRMVVFGDQSNRLPGNLSIGIPGIPNKAVVARVRHRLCVATGAACSSGIEQPPQALQAMNVRDELAEGHLRIGVGKFNTAEEIKRAGRVLDEAVEGVARALSRS